MKLYVIGDSISIQYGPYLEADFRGVMGYPRKEGEEEALLNLDIPQGANGGDSSMVHAFLAAKPRRAGLDAKYAAAQLWPARYQNRPGHRRKADSHRAVCAESGANCADRAHHGANALLDSHHPL